VAIELPAVGPLAQPCRQTLDELLGMTPKTSLGRCGDLSCTFCAAHLLVHEVAATAQTLIEEGGRPMVAALHSVPKNLEPEDAWVLAGPRVAHAMKTLRSKYVAGFDARWTLELDANGLANVHLLEAGKSTPRIGTMRRAFDAVGLGRNVEMQDKVDRPVNLACYASKIGLVAFALPWKGGEVALEFARRLNGGTFSHATPAFYRDAGVVSDVQELAETLPVEVVQWAQGWTHYSEKLPPGLVAELAAIGVSVPVGGCQKAEQESALYASRDTVESWERLLPEL
jgi:hypothetical protein